MIQHDIIPSRIKQARVSRGYSMADLGNLVGVSRQAISKYEIGTYTPTEAVLSRIASVLRYEISFFRKPLPSDAASPSTVFFRSRRSTTKKSKEAAKEKIVSENTGLVWSIARRFMGRGYDLEEIYQIGCIGLLKAIERFELSYEVQFSTYAVPLISGEIKRFLRDNGMIKVSRILKQNGYKISQSREKLAIRLGREATLEELAADSGMEIEDIVMATEANREIESIYQVVHGHDGSESYLVDKLADEIESERTADGLMNRMLVEQAMSGLDEKQKKLIELRYFQDKTQTEVATVLGISQVQVSRLEKKLLAQMRNCIDSKSN